MVEQFFVTHQGKEVSSQLVNVATFDRRRRPVRSPSGRETVQFGRRPVGSPSRRRRPVRSPYDDNNFVLLLLVLVYPVSG